MTFDFAGSVGSALYAALTTSAGTAFYGTRVFEQLAPEGVALPYVVFTQIAGGNDNLTPNSSADLVYSVECIAQSLGSARTGNGYIQSALGSVQFQFNVTGYSNYACQRQEAFARLDNVGGTQYWRRGDNYRVRFDHT